jgi:hypothetical protein
MANMGRKKGSWRSELKGKASPGTGQTLSENFFPEVSSDINADGRADYLNVHRMTDGSVQAWILRAGNRIAATTDPG